MTFIHRRDETGKNKPPKGEHKTHRKLVWGSVIAALCAALAFGGFMLYGQYQMRKIPGLTFAEALAYTTEDNPDAMITVGVIKDGEFSYQVYGENGKELPQALHPYEIGSLTKTFTAAFINQAVQEGKISLDDSIDAYLTLPNGNHYPTIAEILTHTAGYESHYLEKPMISNFFCGRNPFYGVTKEMVLEKAGSLSMEEESYGFHYSNFGYAVLGMVLEAVYDTDYTVLFNHFAKNELQLADTTISEPNGRVKNAWDWKETDAYKSAGAVTSNISDMLRYAQMQLEEHPWVAQCQNSLKRIDAATQDFRAMGIYMDEIGMSWMIDNKNGILWHNGGTGDYNSYLGVDRENQTAVVVLSNLPPDHRISATVLGVKVFAKLKNTDETPRCSDQPLRKA